MPEVKGKRKPRTTPAQPRPGGPPEAPQGTPAPALPVVYPEPVVKEYRKFPDQDLSLTVQDAKDILGWEEEDGDTKFGKECDEILTSLIGRRVRMVHNTRNRPIDVPWLLTLKQEHLNRRWRLNWETIVVSKTRQVNSGQHRLISLILAELEREKDLRGPKKWVRNWPGPVTLESLVVFGAEDDDDTFKTFNSGKSMSFADVLFRSDLLRRFEPQKRRGLAGLVDGALRVIWERTGRKKEAYSRFRTHGESDAFLRGHPRLLRAAEHIYDETVGNAIGKQNLGVPPGRASALLYLFAASETDPGKWREGGEPSEAMLDLRHWELAETFFSLLVSQAPDFRGVREVIGECVDPEKGNGSVSEYTAILVKAWNTFRGGENPKAADCRPEYEVDGDGVRKLLDARLAVGGIDRGPGGGGIDPDTPPDDSPPGEPETKTLPTKDQAEADQKYKTIDLAKSSHDLLNHLREEHAGKVLLFRSKTGDGWRAFELDAKIIQKTCGLVPAKNGVLQVAFPGAKSKEVVSGLQAAGHRVAAVFETDGGPQVEDYPKADPEPNGTEKKPRAGKKK